jgi:hypothetical protein
LRPDESTAAAARRWPLALGRDGMSSSLGASPSPSLHYAELTTKCAIVGCNGEILQARTRWVAFEDLATWPAALAASVDPRDVVRIRFPSDTRKRPAGVDAEVFVLPGPGSEPSSA